MRLSEAQAKVLLGRLYVSPTTKAAKTPQSKKVSVGESRLISHFLVHKVAYETEFKFCPHRRWRSDFRILGTSILVEVEGGTWSGGRHTRGKGYEQDCEKYSWASANGWVVLRFTTQQVKSGVAINTVLDAIK